MKDQKTSVGRIREFNRFYLPTFSLLGNHYLDSEYTVTEARVLFEIYEKKGCNAAYIANVMNIDKSYLSRVIRSHEKRGYIDRQKSENDSRSYRLFLTPEGEKRAEHFIRESDSQIGKIVDLLTEQECRRLIKSMDMIIDILHQHTKEID